MSQPELPNPVAPPGIHGPSFAEPWQAEAFVIVQLLYEQGLFDWTDWTATLTKELNASDAALDGSDYYDKWLMSLSRFLQERGIVDVAEMNDLTAAWQRAAHATPHGKPIRLENDPLFRQSGLARPHGFDH